jgi:hypothetical protein
MYVILNDILGNKTLSIAYIMFVTGLKGSADKKFEGRDETKHRNSWLMPVWFWSYDENSKYRYKRRYGSLLSRRRVQQLHAILSQKSWVVARAVSYGLPEDDD